MKKIKTRKPGGKSSTHYRKERPTVARCANCKKPLHGVGRMLPSQIRKLSKSDRRPERPYGGYLCSNCMREEFKQRAWEE